MKKFLSRVFDNILFIETLFLLIFIPLFPKLPILDVKNTWVYVRAEDFIVLFVLISWIILLLKKKITLRTPLTLPILAFWIIGAIATVHGILIVFPTLANVYPNIAFLNLLRHIEYMSLFFIAYHGMKDKRMLPVVISVLVITLLGVVAYGFGQKYLGFPAYLTMNEEFAKGIPIQLSQLSRVPSTFGGHYDLAAYLVLIIPIMASLFFGFKNWAIKLILLSASLLGFVLLFMTVSRVSFFVLFAALFVVLFFQKRKLIFLSVPLILIFSVLFISLKPTLLSRFNSTVSEVDVLVDAKTGESVGHVKFVPKEYFRDKVVLQRRVKDKKELAQAIAGQDEKEVYSTSSAILPFRLVPPEAALVTAVNVSTGENLPRGTSYINLYLSPVTRRVGNFFYELPLDSSFKASPSAQVLVLHGDFIVKRASAYDLSFTTRFQGEWPNAIEAFKRNILVGSGYGSVSLAVDNNYLRVLGEVGLLGFVSFLVIFMSLGIYIRKVYPHINSPVAKSFVLGFGAGVVGLALNALLIDVFEASKIAFLLWILSGITLGILALYQQREINILSEIKKIATSDYAVIAYMLLFCLVLFSPILNAYFVGDDFTWLRWAADCKDNCGPIPTVFRYFTDSDGFFYRPGAKVYFYLMHSMFWLNQVMYHLVSVLLHFLVASLLYVLAKRILKDRMLAIFAAFTFLILSGSTESIFWISSTGYLFNALFGLLGLIFFILWEERRKRYYYLASFLCIFAAPLFHELGVVFPLLILAYKFKDEGAMGVKNLVKRRDYIFLFVPVLSYLAMRFLAQSHWLSGDYSYNLLKLPLNFAGNILGYVSLTILGPLSLPIYAVFRDLLRTNILLAIVLIPLAGGVLFLVSKLIVKNFNPYERKIIIFGILFFVVSLLPFLGLGNITSRYSYLASFGLVLVLALIVRKIYQYLKESGKETSIGVVSVFIIVFSLFHMIQVQQSYFHWQEAGNKAKRFFISVEALYNNSWSKDNVQFHFVDVPLRVGEAWVFPVGLTDAVWFAFRNDNAKVYSHASLSEALGSAGMVRSNFVLKFTEDGSVKEYDRFRLIMPQ